MGKRVKNNISLKQLEDEMNKIIGLIEDPDVEEKEIISKIKAIKKSYMTYIKNEKVEGTLTEAKLDRLNKIFIGERYRDIRIYTTANEIAEMIGNEYLEMSEQEEQDEEKQKRLAKKAFKIHSKILGNDGTHAEKYDAEYIEKIIIEKVVNLPNPLDNPEILKILKDKIQKNYIDSVATKRLIENAFIQPILVSKVNGKLQEYKYFAILEVLNSYAQMYRYENDFEAYEKYLRLGLEFKQFEGSVQYQEIKNELKEIPELKAKYAQKLEELNKDKEKTLNLGDESKTSEEDKASKDDGLPKKMIEEENLEEYIFKSEFTGDESELNKFIEELDIHPFFKKLFDDEDKLVVDKNEGNGGRKEHNILTNREKMRNIFLALKRIRKVKGFENANISKCYVKKDVFDNIDDSTAEEKIKSFDKYIIFPIEGINKKVFVLESFETGKEGSIYVTNDECLEPVISMKRSRVKKFRNPQVIDFVDHRTEGYVGELTSAIIGIAKGENTRGYRERPLKEFKKYISRERRNAGSKMTTGQIRGILGSLDSLEIENLENLLNILKENMEELDAKCNESVIIKKITESIVARLALYSKQNARIEELEEIRKKEKELMNLIPE